MLIFQSSGKYNPQFKCGTRIYTDHYDCPQIVISQADIEKAVMESIKTYSAVLIEQAELKLAAMQQNSLSREEIMDRIKAEQKSIRILEDSITKNFTELASGKISQESFLQKKEVINNTITQKQTELQRLNECLQTITVGKSITDKTLVELKAFHEIETLDRVIVDLLIEKIFVYGEQEIEIVWSDKY